jgi:hypothetical protein
MPTEKQSAASRANSQKSTGPRTAEGRAKSRFNALKHGIFAESQIIFTESAEDLAELAAEYHGHYNPADPSERCLVDALIETEWRLRRMRRVEAGMWEDKRSSLQRYKTIMEDDPSKRVVTPGEVFCGDDAKFATLQRVISSCHRDYRGALKELRVAQGHALRSATDIPVCRPTTDTPAPSATGIPACRPTIAEPEQTKPTSESPASFSNNSQSTPEPQPTTLQPAPTSANPPTNPPVVAGHDRPSAEPAPTPAPTLPKAA